jgi:hypothetical protein
VKAEVLKFFRSEIGMDDPTDLQALFAFKVTSRATVTDPRIFDAFATIKREAFLGEPPWYRRTYADDTTDETVPEEACEAIGH